MKRHVILLEVLMAAGLFAILLSTLLGTYFRLTRMTEQTRLWKESVQNHLDLQSRLERLFNHILPIEDEQTDKNKEHTYFFTESPLPGRSRSTSLVFTYDNFLDQSADYSSTQLARLYINEEKQLCLTCWPQLYDHKSIKERTEVLAESIENLEMLFYWPPQSDEEEQMDVKPNIGMQTTWLKNYKQLPAIVWLTLFIEGNPTPQEFAFVLLQARHPVLFPMEKILL